MSGMKRGTTYLGVSCFDAVHFAYILVSHSPMLDVGDMYGHWHPISSDLMTSSQRKLQFQRLAWCPLRNSRICFVA